MMKDDFKAGEPISAVGAGWFNAVAAFLNNLVGGYGVNVTKPSKPSPSAPVQIDVDPDVIRDIAGGGVSAPSETDSIESGVQTGSGVTLKTDVFTAGNEDGKGATVYLPCRTVTDGYEADLVFRPFTITADGRIYSIGKETDFQGLLDANSGA